MILDKMLKHLKDYSISRTLYETIINWTMYQEIGELLQKLIMKLNVSTGFDVN